MQPSTKKGFTLIELLIVVVIIGILAAVAIPKFSNTKQRASRSAGIADMRNLATSQEGFYADSNRYAGIGDTGSTAGRMNFTPSPGNTALTIVASATGWNARITIPGGQACGIYHGSAAVPTGMPATTPSGVPSAGKLIGTTAHSSRPGVAFTTPGRDAFRHPPSSPMQPLPAGPDHATTRPTSTRLGCVRHCAAGSR